MTDGELLEAAAKAAGLTVRLVLMNGDLDIGAAHESWNPLTNDGDALRLAVKLSLTIQRPWMDDERTDAREVRVWSSEPDYVFESLVGVDPYAATRRAIVRAAAAMAK